MRRKDDDIKIYIITVRRRLVTTPKLAEQAVRPSGGGRTGGHPARLPAAAVGTEDGKKTSHRAERESTSLVYEFCQSSPIRRSFQGATLRRRAGTYDRFRSLPAQTPHSRSALFPQILRVSLPPRQISIEEPQTSETSRRTCEIRAPSNRPVKNLR